jgi:hypothetical protein
MCELKYKKKMQHLLDINAALYKENQKLKQELYTEKEMIKAIDFGASGMYGYRIGVEGYAVNQIDEFLKKLKNK